MPVIKINVPNIGEDKLEVTEILVKIGDNININQPLLIIEGDKSSMEIPAPYSGIVTKIHINVGDTVYTGFPIFSLNTDNKIQSELSNDEEPVIEHNLNKFSMSKHEQIKRDNKVYVYDNTKHHKETNTSNNFIIHATPLIRHMARQLEIDLSKIKGSGRKGRILKEDIQDYLNASSKYIKDNPPTTPDQSFSSKFSLYPETDYTKFGNITTIELSKIQKNSGSSLQKNWTRIPHVTQFDIVDITNLESFRKQQNLQIIKKKMNYKITILVFVMKAVAKVLEEFPHFNSSLSQDGHTLILKEYINIGIAVDTKQGLLVPVLRDVNKKGIITLSQELSEIAQKARSGSRLTPIDMQGGSFTISNLGGIGGGTAFTPIINAPEVAILGISKSSIHPIWTGKKFIPRLMLPLSLSYDHRAIDGADGVKFINLINKIISDIRLLLM